MHLGADTRAWLEALEERSPVADPGPALAYLAAQQVVLDPAEVHAGRRRALLVLAAGGDPLRELELEGRAVESLAGELDTAERRSQLERALRSLRAAADGLPRVVTSLDGLLADGELAWRSLAAALLAEELAGGDDGGED